MLETLDISTSQTILLVGLIFLAGFVDSIAGGGGLISLPAYFAAGLPAHTALATNKFSSSIGTFSSVIRYFKAGKIHLKVGILAAIGAIIGSAIGAKIALLVSEGIINSIMLVLVPVVLVFFLLQNKIMPKPGQSSKSSFKGSKSFVIGMVIGCYDGFFGPGTGAFMTIAFFSFLRLDMISSSANARMTNLASNLGSLIIFLINAKVLFPLALYTAIGGVAGNLLGSKLALKKRERIIRPLLIVVLFLLIAEVIRQKIYQ